MNEREKNRGERIAFTIDKNTFEQLDKILYMQRRTAKEILIPMVQSYVEQNKNEIKRYDKIFNIESAPVSDKPPTVSTKTTDTVPAVLTPAQRTKAVNIICKFITENDSHFYIKGNAPLEVEQPAYGIKTTDYIAVEKEPLKHLLKAAELDIKAVCSEFEFKIGEYKGKKSVRMLKMTTVEFENYKRNAQNGTNEIDDADRNDDQ